jgi:hypothetical protein
METLFALGKLLYRMGNTSLALVRLPAHRGRIVAANVGGVHFIRSILMRVALLRLNHALDCDSRQSNIIKSLIDRLHEEVLRPPPAAPRVGALSSLPMPLQSRNDPDFEL